MADAIDRKELVDRVATRIAKVPGSRSVVLFGSTARGDWTDSSDIDILVVSENRRSLMQLRWEVGSWSIPVSIVVLSPADTISMWLHGALTAFFISHEGIVCFDDGFWEKQLPSFIPKNDYRQEIERQLNKAEQFRHIERLGGNFVFGFCAFFAAFRNTAMLALAQKGIREPRKFHAIDLYYGHDEELRSYVTPIKDLYGFYLKAMCGRAVDLPFATSDAEKLLYYLRIKDILSRRLL